MNLLTHIGQRLTRSGREALTQYKETLSRLRSGDYDDLSPAGRDAQADQIIQAAARAAVLAGSAPIPFLEMPVQALMVQAIARVYGVERSAKKVTAELAAAMGGGVVLRQLLRRLPIVGAITQTARIHASTLALGHTAKRYYAGNRNREPQSSNSAVPMIPETELHQVFEASLTKFAKAQAERTDTEDFDAQLENLRELRNNHQISEAEYRKRRDDLLQQL